MKFVIALLLSCFSFSSVAGKLYYSKNFTSSQKFQVEECYKLDGSFPQQVNKLTASGDILLTGMVAQKNGSLFFTLSNAYGKWIEYTPLFCDIRSKEDKKIDAEEHHKRNLESARQKAKKDIEVEKENLLAEKRAAEIRKIEEEATAKLELIRNEKIQAERIKQEKLKKEGDELAFKYREQAKVCVRNDAERVKSALLSVLPSIHHPGAIHIEDWKITKLSFLKNINAMKVAYNFKIYTQTQFRKKLGSKSEPIGLKDTQDIDVKAYGRSTAIATCRIN